MHDWDAVIRRRLSCPSCAALAVRTRSAARGLRLAASSCGRRGIPVRHDAEPREMEGRLQAGSGAAGHLKRIKLLCVASRCGGRILRPAPQPDRPNLARAWVGSGVGGGGRHARRIRRQRHAGMRRTAGFRQDVPADPPGGADPDRNRSVGTVRQGADSRRPTLPYIYIRVFISLWPRPIRM